MKVAHKRELDDKEQSIKEHLDGTAKRCQKFGDEFQQGQFAMNCGLLHDLGKYSNEFQERINGNGRRCDHSTAGCVEAMKRFPFGKIASYCIAGHHSGLMNSGSIADVGGQGTLCSRLSSEYKVPDYDGEYKNELELSKVNFNINFEDMAKLTLDMRGSFQMSFFTRMIYSCLTDSDFLDTEEFMCPHINRTAVDFNVDYMLDKLNDKLKTFKNSTGLVNDKRREILNDCINSANRDRGLFSLTVPTGGGKTLSSLAFALNHAKKNGMRRIIYVIPYTSIIEQNAQVFSDVIGDEYILQHHSNFSFSDDENDIYNNKKLASENWDMPIVVTTNVQFFESLFANKSSKCRKLHNISNSVIIFDEAQMFPVEVLKPSVMAIYELVKNYRCSAVLCSATQPALKNVFPNEMVTSEICNNIGQLYDVFKRTEIIQRGILTDNELSQEIAGVEQCLVIVNTRRHALHLYSQLEGEGVYHLSTLMCPKHRKKTIHEIIDRLNNNQSCKVISTRLIEAGVDVDFPVVYRSLCGLDSLIQSAGRCNREGRLTDENGNKTFGRVNYFKAEDKYYKNQPSSMSRPISISEEVSRSYRDITSPEAITSYFEKLYSYGGEEGLDTYGVMKELENGFPSNPHNEYDVLNFNFSNAAKKYKIINSDTYSVIIPYDKNATKLIEQLVYKQDTGENIKIILRRLQQYTVNIYKGEFTGLNSAGKLKSVGEDSAILINENDYDQGKGLNITDNILGVGVFL